MPYEDLIKPEVLKRLDELLSSDVYRENLEFWERAWGMVKSAYTQLPDLPYLARIPDELRKHGAKSVLDLGCGSGWLSIYLGKTGFSVTGIDISRHAIKLAREWASKEDLDIEFEVGDVAELPFPDSSFDAVVANSIFEHFPRAVSLVTVERLKHLLAPGGVFIGCFDKVGGGPGEYFELDDATHVYTDKARKGMLLRCYSDEELESLFKGWKVENIETYESGTRFLVATT